MLIFSAILLISSTMLLFISYSIVSYGRNSKPKDQSDGYELIKECVEYWQNKIYKAEKNDRLPSMYSDNGERYVLAGIGKNGINCHRSGSSGYDCTKTVSFNTKQIKSKFSDVFQENDFYSKKKKYKLTKEEYDEYIKYKKLYQDANLELKNWELDKTIQWELDKPI